MKQSTAPTIETAINFRRQLAIAPREVKFAFADALQIFVTDPHHESLHNHALKDQYAGFRSINVTSDWRAIYKARLVGEKKFTIFYFLGTHKQLYGA